MPPPSPDLPSFDGFVVRKVKRDGAVHKGRVSIAERDGVVCVVKDLGPMRPILRRLYGRRNLAREARALERLADFPGTPRLLRRISKDAIAVEFVRTLHKYLRDKIPREQLPAILRSFEETVAALHARGFVHLDLRQRKNVLVPTADRVVLIDFESSRDLSGPIARRLLLPWLARIDRAAVRKWKVKLAPEICSPEEIEAVARYGRWKRVWPWKRLGRIVRRWFGDDVAR
ncbi:MAG: hypothetical protein ACF8XB_00870 [Planctomycetota bacterium JB042]